MSKKTALFLIGMLGAILSTSLFAHGARAIELTYPSFFALNQVTSLGGLVSLIFTASLGVGALIAVGVIMVSGFQFAFSSANPSLRLSARQRFVAALVGLAILAAAALFLQTINPQLLSVSLSRNIELPEIPSSPTPP